MLDQQVERASRFFNVPRWFVKSGIWFVFLWVALALLFFGSYFLFAPYYRSLHFGIEVKNIERVEFRNFSYQGFVVNQTEELSILVGLIRELKLESKFKPRKSHCKMTVFLKDGNSIQYNVIFDFDSKKAIATIRGNANWAVGGISMGYLSPRDSQFFEWLTHSSRFGTDPKKLNYCSTLRS